MLRSMGLAPESNRLEAVSILPADQQAAEAPLRSSSALSDRRMVNMQPLTAFRAVFSRAENARSATGTADFGPMQQRPGSESPRPDQPIKGTPTFCSLTNLPSISDSPPPRSATMPSGCSLPGCVEPSSPLRMGMLSKQQLQHEREVAAALEERPDADAAAGTGGMERLLLREQRELRRQMEEWMRQLLFNQDQLLKSQQSQPRCGCHSQLSRPTAPTPGLLWPSGTDEDHAPTASSSRRPRPSSEAPPLPEVEPSFERGDSDRTGITDILQPFTSDKSDRNDASKIQVVGDDVSEVACSPDKNGRYTPWTEMSGGASPSAVLRDASSPSPTPGSPQSPQGKRQPPTPIAASERSGAGPEADQKSVQTPARGGSFTPFTPRRAGSFLSTPSRTPDGRLVRRRSSLSLFRDLTTPRKAQRRGLSRGSTINLDSSSPLQRFVHGKNFSLFVVVLIVANTAFVAFEMDSNLKSQFSRIRTSEPDHKGEITYVGLAFTLMFAVEMLLRVVADQRHFFLGHDRHWNISDLAMVVLGVLEQICQAAWGTRQVSFLLPNVTAGRILRIVSLMRATHMTCLVKTVHHMRTMMFLILGSVFQLLRALVILFFVMYIFALIFMYGVVKYLESSSAETARILSIESSFGGFGSAILTLFMAMSGGQDWIVFWEDATELGSAYGWLFAFYIAFVIIGVLNVLTGVFVDSALQMAQADRDVAVAEQMAHKETYMNDLRELFMEADADESGSLSWNEFKEHLKDDRVKAYLSSLELDVTQARGLFKLLDTSQRDEVGIDDFVSGCMRLKGGAKSIDVCTLLYENRKMARSFSASLRDLKFDLNGMVKKLQAGDAAAKPGCSADGRAGSARTHTEPPLLPLGAAGGRFRPRLDTPTEIPGSVLEDQRPSGFIDDGLLPRPTPPEQLGNIPRPETPFSALGGFGPWAEEANGGDEEGSPLALNPLMASPLGGRMA